METRSIRKTGKDGTKYSHKVIAGESGFTMNSTISYVLSSNTTIKESDLWALVGRDELYIERAPGLNKSNEASCLGSMTVDIEKSKYKGQNCFFVNFCTSINRNGMEHSCFVSSFVDLNLNTLEERRLIVAKGSKLVPALGLKDESQSDLQKLRTSMQVVETCRSTIFVPGDPEKQQEDKLLVSEWRRRNGLIDPDHSAPMNIEVELSAESGFVSDASLLLVEKLLARIGHFGRFQRIATLDKRGMLAPITLGVIQDGEFFKATKSSPVDKGNTETVYNKDGKMVMRIITTAQNLKYYLQPRNKDLTGPSMPLSSEEKSSNSNDPIQKRLYEESFGNNLMQLQSFLLSPPDHCSLVDLLKDVLQDILFHKPDDPVTYIQKYFGQFKTYYDAEIL